MNQSNARGFSPHVEPLVPIRVDVQMNHAQQERLRSMILGHPSHNDYNKGDEGYLNHLTLTQTIKDKNYTYDYDVKIAIWPDRPVRIYTGFGQNTTLVSRIFDVSKADDELKRRLASIAAGLLLDVQAMLLELFAEIREAQ